MIKKQILSIMVLMGLCIPSYVLPAQAVPEKTGKHIEQLKKASKLAGYGVLTAAGIGCMALSGLGVFGQLVLDPTNKPSKQEIDNTTGCNKQLMRIKRMIIPTALPNDADFVTKFSHKGSFLIGASMISALGLGLAFFGIRGIQKTIGQTAEEKEIQQENDEKIKQTIKDTGRLAFDISRRSVRVALYSLITTAGATATLSAIVLGLRAATNAKESMFSMKRYKFANFGMDHAKNNAKDIIGAIATAPLGLGIFAFGVRGLKKEYHSWKESKTREDIESVVQSMKDKLEETVEGAIDTVANAMVDEPKENNNEKIITGIEDEKI
jgi:hypothetical protein